DPPCLVAVAVALRAAQRTHEDLVGEQERVEQRGVHPGEQRGVVRGVGRARRVRALPRVERAVHAVVDAVDRLRGAPGLDLAAEGEGEHRAERPAESLDVAARLDGEAAVPGHPLRHQWMSELQENGPPPAGEQGDLAMELPGYGARPRRAGDASC